MCRVIFLKFCFLSTIVPLLGNLSAVDFRCARGAFLWLTAYRLFLHEAQLAVVWSVEVNLGSPQLIEARTDLLGSEYIVNGCYRSEVEVATAFPLERRFSELNVIDMP